MARVFAVDRYIGATQYESWGLWNLNVFTVERHFPFVLGLVVIAMIYLVRTGGALTPARLAPDDDAA
jgi:hypothetical protein